MEEQQSSSHCVSSQQQEHSISNQRASLHLPEAALNANSTAASSHQHLQFPPRVGGIQATLAEKEDSLSPAVPSLLHLPLCRQTTPVPGLRYRNLGKSGLRVSNVGLGEDNGNSPYRVTPASWFLVSAVWYLKKIYHFAFPELWSSFLNWNARLRAFSICYDH